MLKNFYDDEEAAKKFVQETEDSVLHRCDDEFYVICGEMTGDDLLDEMEICGDVI